MSSTFHKNVVVGDESIMKVIMSFHINTEKEKNNRKYDRVMKVMKNLRWNMFLPDCDLGMSWHEIKKESPNSKEGYDNTEDYLLNRFNSFEVVYELMHSYLCKYDMKVERNPVCKYCDNYIPCFCSCSRHLTIDDKVFKVCDIYHENCRGCNQC